MKRQKIYFRFIMLFSLSIITGSLFAQKITVSDEHNGMIIQENTYTKMTVVSKLGNMDHFGVKTKEGVFELLNADEFGFSMDIGDPQVPVLKKLIEVPFDAGFQVNILSETFSEYSLQEFGIEQKLIPAQAPLSKSIEDPDDVEFNFNPQTYQVNDYLYQERIKVIPVGIMRGVRLARIEIYAVQYNPVQNKIKVFDNIRFEINFIGADVQKTINTKKELFSPYFESNFNQVVNYKSEITDELIMYEPVTYVIVSDPMFENALNPFVQWKTKKGFQVIEGYTNNPSVGTTTTSIKSYLQNLYDNPPAGYNPPSFVLFVGDVAQIPTYTGTAGSHVTDLYYCEYTGDKIPECYYGRFSANNLTELQPQLDKTLQYEQYLMPDPSFLDEVVMVAGADGSFQTHSNGQINYGTTYYFNLAHGLTSHTYLQPEPGGANYSANIRQNVSDGVSYANYTAHCSSNGWADPSFNISHIAALTNANKYPLMVGNCCQSVMFGGTCFGEEILRAANKGALGYIGGSNNTYWNEDYYWGVGYRASIVLNPVYSATNLGAYDRTFHDHGEPQAQWYVTQGQMPSAGNLAVTQSGSGLINYYWEIYHLMGDPSVMIYYSQPPVTTASYAGLMPLGATSFNVQTQPYAYVAISKDADLHGAAIADATGLAEVALTPITVPGTADVVVTRQNGQPFIGTVTVASPSGPYLLFKSFAINDNAGNNNGQIDFNENVLLNVTLENVGSQTATNVSATILSPDSYLTITDNSNPWPNIPAGATSLQNGAFGIHIADNAPDQHTAFFDIQMTDGSENWTSNFNITINAPSLSSATNLIINDQVGGNNNGRLDPGETATITIVVNNMGHSSSPSATAFLASASPYITVNAGNSVLGTIAAGSSANAVFQISCSPSTPVGQSVDLTMNVTAGNYGFNQTYYTTVGIVLEDWETGNFKQFPWTFGGNAPWTITTAGPYEGTYTAKSGTITHSQTTDLIVQLQVSQAGNISFYRKVSSESGYDYLRFFIDGVQQEQWAGEVAWSQVSYPVTVGLHTFTWRYYKDGSVNSGSDCAWVDYIVFPSIAPMTADISVNPLMIDFGEVLIGTTDSKIITISNNGAANLTGSITSPVHFSLAEVGDKADFKNGGKNTFNFTINPGGSKQYFVLFAPQDPTCYNGTIEVSTNDPDSPIVYPAVTGCGVIGPDISVNPGQFTKSLTPGGTTNDVLNIANTGGMTLDYSAQVIYDLVQKSTITVYPVNANYNTGTTTSSAKTQTSLVKGYPTAEAGWMKFDISGIPDGATINSVEFHGYVNATYYPYWSITPVSVDPVTASPSVLYNDIIAEASTGYYLYQNESSSYTTGWKTHTLIGSANINLQAALAQNWFAIGIFDRDGSSTYYIGFDGWNEANKPYLVVEYTYISPYSWLKINGGNSISGSVNPGSYENISLNFEAGTLGYGTYTANIKLTSNDPDPSQIMLPCTLNVVNGFNLNLTAMLEGPFTGTTMSTVLGSNGLLPMNQPYNMAPWNYSGSEFVVTVPTNAVDWVLVELRDAVTAGNATSATRIARQAGFVLSNGNIVAADGNPMFFTASVANNLFVVIHHRNHLGIMSADPLVISGNSYNYDFSTGFEKTYGGILGCRQLSLGIWGLIGGDSDCDGQISMLDINVLWKPNAGHSGYDFGDFNLDGQIDNKDKDDCWQHNYEMECQVPD